jgi:2-C-methyl-D-erythritol 4-phosphate cytidylyltransferase
MVYAIVVAAGKGKRMQSPISKPYIEILKKPILAYTLKAISNSQFVDNIILVVEAVYIEYCKREIIKKYKIKKVEKVIEGGMFRQDSVYRGLRELPPHGCELVLIHDGVRPFVRQDEIVKLIEAASVYGAAILAVPETETIKLVKDGFIEETLPRQKLWQAKTPQVFKYEIIQQAYKIGYKQEFYGTDDASLVERINYKVKIIESDAINIKITTPQDIILAENILKQNPEFRF